PAAGISIVPRSRAATGAGRWRDDPLAHRRGARVDPVLGPGALAAPLRLRAPAGRPGVPVPRPRGQHSADVDPVAVADRDAGRALDITARHASSYAPIRTGSTRLARAAQTLWAVIALLRGFAALGRFSMRMRSR